MKVRLHIERLVVDEGVLARGDRDGLAELIQAEVQHRLAHPGRLPDASRRDLPPPHIQAIGAGIIERIPPAPGRQGAPR